MCVGHLTSTVANDNGGKKIAAVYQPSWERYRRTLRLFTERRAGATPPSIAISMRSFMSASTATFLTPTGRRWRPGSSCGLMLLRSDEAT